MAEEETLRATASKRASAFRFSFSTAARSLVSAWKPSRRWFCEAGRAAVACWLTTHGCWRTWEAVRRLDTSGQRRPMIKSLHSSDRCCQASLVVSILPCAMLERISASEAEKVGSKGLKPHIMMYATTPSAHMSMACVQGSWRTTSGAQ
jgi:hypothetical protein